MRGMRILVGLSSMLSFGAVSCGGSGGGAGAGSVTTVPGNMPLATLTPAQTMQLCADLNAYAGRNISSTDQCKVAGVTAALIAVALGTSTTDAELQAACTSTYNSCIASGSDGGTSQCDIGSVDTCAPTATISELTACAADEVAATKQVAASLPACSALTASSISTATTGLATAGDTATCTKLQTDCPDLNSP